MVATAGMGQAIWTSVGIAAVVQVIALLVGRSFGRKNMLAGWGIGAILRLLAVMVYGWAVVPALGLPMAPALLSLVALLFVTTLVEPLLLAR